MQKQSARWLNLAFASAADALNHLIDGSKPQEGKYCWISFMPDGVKFLANGLEYYAVEVTFSSGEQYSITAYGAEAVELFGQAIKLRNLAAITERVPHT